MRTLKAIAFGVGAVVAGLYIINPTAGILELIPDNIPIWGNLDEAGATALLIFCIKGLKGLSQRPPAAPVGAP